MKKIMILITAIAFIHQVSQAQTEKGTQTIGTDLSFGSSNSNQQVFEQDNQPLSAENSKTTSFSVGPTYSYFIADKLDLGVSGLFQSDVTTYNPNIYNSELNKELLKYYDASFFLRKYVMFTDKIGIRTGPYINFEKVTQKTDYSGTNATDNMNDNQYIISGGLNLDFVYYPYKHLGIAARIANLFYEYDKTDNAEQGSGDAHYVNFDFISNNLSLSVFYVFGGK